MNDLKYFYAGGSMGFGNGYIWHKLLGFNFPSFPIITKTITLKPKTGYPYAIILTGKSVFNHVGHHNLGFEYFLRNHYREDLIVSISGTDDEIEYMVGVLDNYKLGGIQLSFSCPNVQNNKNKLIPKSNHDLYLKLNYLQDHINMI